MTYCTRLNLSNGHLIYAAGEPHAEPFDIEGADVGLVIHRIDLQQDVEDIESQVAAILNKIVPPDCARAVW